MIWSDFSVLEKSLKALYENEDAIEQLEREAEIYRLRKCQKVYKLRQSNIANIDNFWYVVLSQHEDFAEYVEPVEYKYFEYLRDVYVEWEVAVDETLEKPGNFSLTFKFEGGEFGSQVVTKRFYEKDDELVSDKVAFQWPATEVGKDKSFFGIFEWTSSADSQKVCDGGEIGKLFAEDIFPYAVKYYLQAHNDQLEEEMNDGIESEPELDVK